MSFRPKKAVALSAVEGDAKHREVEKSIKKTDFSIRLGCAFGLLELTSNMFSTKQPFSNTCPQDNTKVQLAYQYFFIAV